MWANELLTLSTGRVVCLHDSTLICVGCNVPSYTSPLVRNQMSFDASRESQSPRSMELNRWSTIHWGLPRTVLTTEKQMNQWRSRVYGFAPEKPHMLRLQLEGDKLCLGFSGGITGVVITSGGDGGCRQKMQGYHNQPSCMTWRHSDISLSSGQTHAVHWLARHSANNLQMTIFGLHDTHNCSTGKMGHWSTCPPQRFDMHAIIFWSIVWSPSKLVWTLVHWLFEGW